MSANVLAGLYEAVIEDVQVGLFEGYPSVAIRFYSSGGPGQQSFRGFSRIDWKPCNRKGTDWAVRRMRAIGFEGYDLHTLDRGHPRHQSLIGNTFTVEAITRGGDRVREWVGDARTVFAVYALVDPDNAAAADKWVAASEALRRG